MKKLIVIIIILLVIFVGMYIYRQNRIISNQPSEVSVDEIELIINLYYQFNAFFNLCKGYIYNMLHFGLCVYCGGYIPQRCLNLRFYLVADVVAAAYFHIRIKKKSNFYFFVLAGFTAFYIFISFYYCVIF